MATIQPQPIAPTPEVARALVALEGYDWILFTSEAGVRAAPHPDGLKSAVAVVGPHTEAAARAVGWRVAFRPSQATAEALASELPAVTGRRVLLLQAREAHGDIEGILKKRGAAVTGAAIYETILVPGADAELNHLLASGEVASMLFASPSAVVGLLGRVSDENLGRVRGVPAIAIGPTTHQTLRDNGFEKVAQTPEPTIQSAATYIAQLTP